MEVLKIATAGSVDDGKSTLIGRLLYDTNSITQDKLEAIDNASKNKGLDYTDLSLLTDGLIAEREQGITIDVAHIYFSTPKRKYIIADTPGHFEYTRNMVTGASKADVSIILIDARKGVIEQTFRHFYISTLLRIKNVVVAVNKMDLVNYSEEYFNKIKQEFSAFAKKLKFDEQQIQFIPVSSLYGENIVTKSDKTPWYDGGSLLDYLENVDVKSTDISSGRLPVQYVIRPKSDKFHDYRAYAGRIAGGSFRVGEEVLVLPSGRKSTIKKIEKFDKEIALAKDKESVKIILADDVDISRGDMIASASNPPLITKQLKADISWMQNETLTLGKTYLLQHGVNRVKAKISAINYSVDVTNLEKNSDVSEVKLNEIAQVEIRLAKEIFVDDYQANKNNGAFILIDESSNNTAGVGMIK